MSIFHGWRCDECGKCVNTEKPPERLPRGWNQLFIQRQSSWGAENHEDNRDFHDWNPQRFQFCSRTCLLTAVTEIPARRQAKGEAEIAERLAIQEATENVRKGNAAA